MKGKPDHFLVANQAVEDFMPGEVDDVSGTDLGTTDPLDCRKIASKGNESLNDKNADLSPGLDWRGKVYGDYVVTDWGEIEQQHTVSSKSVKSQRQIPPWGRVSCGDEERVRKAI